MPFIDILEKARNLRANDPDLCIKYVEIIRDLEKILIDSGFNQQIVTVFISNMGTRNNSNFVYAPKFRHICEMLGGDRLHELNIILFTVTEGARAMR